ncbi:MAG: Uroporphyrinogen-III C-methyltransferase [bacterium ADurb.Bin429]|nr:MAG: Uroporphyrinogen-III C-methyltransferase [bacterium ADurb.Bin429]
MTDSSSTVAPGTVYLVGAGPGDPGLLTRAGADAIARADVIVHDRLANPSLLALARTGVEYIYVGKASSAHTLTQDEINEVLAVQARRGKCVCRLKGGDPFVFGRGGEEAVYLRERGIPYVVVPGITSAIAVPAYAGIPVTDRRCASSFAVITGHEDAEKTESTLDWAGIAGGADTLVFLMGLSNLPEISRQLIANGRPAATPAASIQSGTTPNQRVVTGTLTDIADRVKEAGLRSPVITVVGEVVTLRRELAWFDTRPLFGKRILVTRSRAQASALSELLAAAGAVPVEVPVIRCETLPPINDLLSRLRLADWLVFTSANGLPALLEQVTALGGDIRALGEAKIAAIGPATAESLRRHHLHVDYMAERFVAEALAEGFPNPMGTRIVIARAEEARDVLPDTLRERGAKVEILPVYRTVPEPGEAPDLSTVDAITFTSSSTVKNFRVLVPGPVEGPVVACIGPVTAQTARKLGLRVDIEAASFTVPDLVAALERYFAPTPAPPSCKEGDE